MMQHVLEQFYTNNFLQDTYCPITISSHFFLAISPFHLPELENLPEPPPQVSIFQRQKELGTVPNNPTPLRQTFPPPQIPQCQYCLQYPCITLSPFKPQARGNAHITNHVKRLKDYRWYWRTLKDCGLWEDPVYLAHKTSLGCLIDDIREVMPHCVLKDVRGRWPNPEGVPYQGHRRH